MMTNFGRLLQVPAEFQKKSSQRNKSVASINSNFPSATKVTKEAYFFVCFGDVLLQYVKP
jgi:hypothetical protein